MCCSYNITTHTLLDEAHFRIFGVQLCNLWIDLTHVPKEHEDAVPMFNHLLVALNLPRAFLE